MELLILFRKSSNTSLQNKSPLIQPQAMVNILSIRIYLPLLTAISFTACNSSYNEDQIKALSRNIEAANSMIEDDIDLMYRKHDNNIHDPAYKSIAEALDPALMGIRKHTGNTIRYLDSLKRCVRNVREPRTEGIKKLIKGQEDALYNVIAGIASHIDTLFNNVPLSNDSLVQSVIRKNMMTYKREIDIRFSSGRDSLPIDKIGSKAWSDNNFSGATSIMIIAMLNKLQHDVLLTEYDLVTYIHRSQVFDKLRYYSNMPVAILNRSAVKTGDSIEVRAGVGSFSEFEGLQITIDGKPVPVNQQHIGIYKLTAKGSPGNYTIPVTIQFKEFNDRKVQSKEYLHYTILP